MSVTEVLGALGSWELRLAEHTPDHIHAQLGYFGHVVVVDGPVDVQAAGNALLTGARYVGVCRTKDDPDEHVRGGAGLVFWLGDEDGKGHVIETEISLANATLAQTVTALLPPTVVAGVIHPQANPAARYTGKHVFQSRRDALTIALAAFDAEYRVNGDFTVDIGTPAQLYNTESPDRIIKRKAVGSDVDLTAVGGAFDPSGSAVDYSNRIVLLGQTIGSGDVPDQTFVTATQDAPSVPYTDPRGNPVKLTRLISESGQTQGSAAARVQLQLNRFNRTQRSLQVTADDFEIAGTMAVGDAVYVFDPDTGIVNPALEVFFRGQPLNPDVVRVSERTWPIVEGMTVAWRTDAGAWLDLTPWVVWETAGSHELTVGDLPKTLTRAGRDPVQDRVDAARGTPSTKQPKTPTGLALTTTSALNTKGVDTSVITAAWDPVTQYTDDTTVALHHYELAFRPAFRAPQWTGASLTADTAADLLVVPALGYDVRVRAVSTGGVVSDWSVTGSITSAADTAAPPAPADAVVSSVLGQARIEYVGTSATGTAMPADTNRIDVHIGTSAGFTAAAATRVDSLNPFARGVSYATVPYGAAQRWVKLVAVDHAGNSSASSAAVPLTASQVVAPDVFDGAIGTAKLADLAVTNAKIGLLAVNDANIGSLNVGKLTAGVMTADVTISGRFATAPTGSRREVNAIGFQAFDASNNLIINLDGVNNLLTGRFQTALSGRRIIIGAAGATGRIQLVAPDGTLGEIVGYTSGGAGPGEEAIRVGIPIAGTYGAWNGFQVEAQEQLYGSAQYMQFTVGGDAPTGSKSFIVSYATNRGSPGALWNAETRLLLDATQFQLRDQATNLRFWQSTDSTAIYNPVAGGFTVLDRLAAGTTRLRINVDGNGETTLWRLSGLGGAGNFTVADINAAGQGASRFVISDTDTHILDQAGNLRLHVAGSRMAFRMGPQNSTGMIEMVPGSDPGFLISPGLRITTPQINGTGGVFAGMFLYAVNDDGTNFGIEARNGENTAFIPLKASHFLVNSDRAGKTDIADADDLPALDLLRATPVRRYRRTDRVECRRIRTIDSEHGPIVVDDGPDPAFTPPEPAEEIGLIAQEVPAQMQARGADGQLGYSLAQYTAIQHKAIQELADAIDDIRRRIPA